MGANAAAFASSTTFSITEHSTYEGVEIDFNDDTHTVLNFPALRFESFLQDINRPAPKVVYGSKLGDNFIIAVEQHHFGFQFVKDRKTVYLKLPGFLIAFPFHSFP